MAEDHAPTYEDIEVRTTNPTALDGVVQQLGAAVVVAMSWNGDTCTVRAFGGCAGYIRFAITHQGYGEVVSHD